MKLFLLHLDFSACSAIHIYSSTSTKNVGKKWTDERYWCNISAKETGHCWCELQSVFIKSTSTDYFHFIDTIKKAQCLTFNLNILSKIISFCPNTVPGDGFSWQGKSAPNILPSLYIPITNSYSYTHCLSHNLLKNGAFYWQCSEIFNICFSSSKLRWVFRFQWENYFGIYCSWW